MRARPRALIPALALLAAGLPVAAQGIEPFRAQEVQPVRAQPVRPEPRKPDPKAQAPTPATEVSFFFRTFGLAVPGVAYSWDNLAAQTRTQVVAAGTPTRGAIRVRPDGTYLWHSAWENRLIEGRWIPHRDGILLQHAQEKRDWVLGRLPTPRGAAVVYLYDGASMTYHGTPQPGR